MQIILQAAIFVKGVPHKVGEKIEVENKFGNYLINIGQAKPVKAAPESAIAPVRQAETADLTDQKRTKRK